MQRLTRLCLYLCLSCILLLSVCSAAADGGVAPDAPPAEEASPSAAAYWPNLGFKSYFEEASWSDALHFRVEALQLGTSTADSSLHLRLENVSEQGFDIHAIYYVEKLVDGRWYRLLPSPRPSGVEIGMDTAVRSLYPGESYDWTLSLSGYAGPLEPGEYRVTAWLDRLELDPGESQRRSVAVNAPFTIQDIPADTAEDYPFLASHPDTRLSTDVLLSLNAYGTDMDSFFLDLQFRNLSQATYCLENRYFLEKYADGQWAALPERTSLNGITIGSDSVLLSVSPGEVYSAIHYPCLLTEEPLVPGTRYRILTRLYEYSEQETDSYILAAAEFSYPAFPLVWYDSPFPAADAYTPMAVRPEWPDSIGNKVLVLDFTLPDDGGDSASLLYPAHRVYLERLEMGFYWKTAPLFENRSLLSRGSFSRRLGRDFRCQLYPARGYALEPGVPYRLILQLDYCYKGAEDQVFTASFCGPFTIPDTSAD